jgi:hypothetical protein
MQQAFLTRELIQLMINSSIENYDSKTSLPRHVESQNEMRSMKVILDQVCTVLTKIEGGFTAFKWIGSVVAFVWTVTQLAHTALNVIEALHVNEHQ